MIKLGSVGHVLYSKKQSFSTGRGAEEIKFCSCALKVAVSSLHLVPVLLLRDLMGNRSSEHREESAKQ